MAGGSTIVEDAIIAVVRDGLTVSEAARRANLRPNTVLQWRVRRHKHTTISNFERFLNANGYDLAIRKREGV